MIRDKLPPKELRLENFNYRLPKEFIAQFPCEKRDQSRLMVLKRKDGTIAHRSFFELTEYLRPGDILVLNNTKVIPARLRGKKTTGGKVEILLISDLRPPKADGISDFLNRKSRIPDPKSNRWHCLIKPSQGLKAGSPIVLDSGLNAQIIGKERDNTWIIEFHADLDMDKTMEQMGKMPLPPYIKRDVDDDSADTLDRERYQTVFAKQRGAIAAPTAGLHFTQELLKKIQDRGVEIFSITLHTGLGTFKPVKEDDIAKHKMLPEYYEVDPVTFEAIQKAKQENRRIIAVGSTVARTLETVIKQGWERPNLSGNTDLFIYPGYRFHVVDILITNFHLPKSTLLMLVAAFAGRDFIMKAYQEAVKELYRFFSYGDAMMIL